MAKKKNNKSKHQAKEATKPQSEVTTNTAATESIDQTEKVTPAESNGENEKADSLSNAESKEADEPKTEKPDVIAEHEGDKEDAKQDLTSEAENPEPESAQIKEESKTDAVPESDKAKETTDATDPQKSSTQSETVKQEPSVETTPEPQVPKKRLTLQERLALAAKSKGKAKRNVSSPTTSTSTPPPENEQPKPATPEVLTRENSVEPQDVKSPDQSSLPSTREPSLDLKRPEPPSLFPKDFKNLPIEELHKFISDAENKFLSLESKNESLNIEKQSLQEKVKNLGTSVSAPSSVSSQLIKEKDDKIAQLLKEGENLSMKELKYTNTIKKLKSNETQYEKDLQKLSSIVENLEAEKKASKDEIKHLKDSEQQSSNKSKTLQKQLDNEKESLKEEISRNKELSKKIEELSQVLIQEKNQASNTINELKRSLEKEKNKLQSVQQDSIAEVNRLEAKIEQLRFQSENAQASTGTEEEGYLKLIRQHDTLQNQYTSATENWQSIEASLGSRISSLENDLSSVNEKLSDSQKKNEVLTNDLGAKTKEIEDLKNDLKKLNSEYSLLKTKSETLNKENKDLVSTLEGKELSFGKERAAFEYKIQALERQFKDSIQPQHLSVPSSNNPLEFSPHAGFSSTPSFKRGNSWEIGLGESSTTPRQSRKSSALFVPQYNQNNGSFDESAENGSDFDDTDTVNSPVSAYNNGSRFENNSSSAINGGSSVQLLGKLSSQIRRLEIESSTKDEELEKLTKDMKDANEEIVRLMKDNEHVDNYKQRIKELEDSVEAITQRHEKALEILGEKSEQVEELRADIQDWKDLCRQQVQQLADKA